MKKVFLGGTCNGSRWRDRLIPLLDIDYFNPVVEEWNDKAQQEEMLQRENCDYCLYVLTPKMEGVYSVAEVVDAAQPNDVVLILSSGNFDGLMQPVIKGLAEKGSA